MTQSSQRKERKTAAPHSNKEAQEHTVCRWLAVMRQAGNLQFRPVHHLLVVVLCLFATLCWTDAVAGNGWRNFVSRGELPESKQWSSFFTVDPSKILSVLINRGGLLMPKSVEKELLALAKVLHVDEAKLNLIERELFLRNFTVGIPGSRESLRVGSVHVRWDSYISPCVDIEVEDVGVLVEFTNLKLTESNWNELEDAGFPPAMEYYETEEESSAESSTFVRIGSVDLSGKVRLEISSRPLERPITTIVYGLDTLQDLNNEIREVSETNLADTGRRGCTMDEMYIILQTYFAGRIRNFLRDAAYDVTASSLLDKGSTTIKEARCLLASASDVIKNYADDVGRKKGDDLQELLAIRLDKLGLPSPREKLSTLREMSLQAARNIDAKKLAAGQWERLQVAYETAGSSSASGDAENDVAGRDANKHNKDEIMEEIIRFFPDW